VNTPNPIQTLSFAEAKHVSNALYTELMSLLMTHRDCKEFDVARSVGGDPVFTVSIFQATVMQPESFVYVFRKDHEPDEDHICRLTPGDSVNVGELTHKLNNALTAFNARLEVIPNGS
jgi:hypothetical protein